MRFDAFVRALVGVADAAWSAPAHHSLQSEAAEERAVGSAQVGSTTGERMHALLEYIEATYRGEEGKAPQSSA